jgi:C4-dicarboxylate transporter DctM subunit
VIALFGQTQSLFLILPLVLLFLGAPIFLILLTTALVTLFLSDMPPSVVQTVMFGSLGSFPLLAIPFFILAGEIMGRGGIAKRLVDWVLAMVGGVRGSLSLATIVSSELFGAMSGSAVGTLAAVGRLLFPALRTNGYGDRFSVSLIASSGAIAIVIPPSIAMIIYGVTAQVPLKTLFTAGILPALFIGVIDAIYVLAYSHMKRIPILSKAYRRNFWAATKDAGWALGTIFVIFGGIYGGIFTPTEAAGVAVVYSALVARFIYREVSWRDLWNIAGSAATLTAQILLIVACAGVYSWVLTTSGIPGRVVDYITALHAGPVITLLMMNVVLLLVGSFLEPPAAILILVPLCLPLAKAIGVDAIHFGVIFAVNLSIGMYMPPFGLNIFAANLIFKRPIGEIYRGLVPFLIINLVALMVITYVPAISLALVSTGR